MKCPDCQFENPAGVYECVNCGLPLEPLVTKVANASEQKPVEEKPPEKKLPQRLKKIGRVLLIILIALAVLFIFGLGVYKLIYWIQDYRITRLYTRGAYTPTLTQTTMSDGREGHALVFYGTDGDTVFIPEMNRSLTICGGVTRLEVADSDWFSHVTGDFDHADITFNPILMRANGKEVRLPTINYTIDAPPAPLKVITPASNDLTVNTSAYPLELQVVPGSSVYVNGEDVTARLDRSGYMSAELKVRPIGQNVYTVVVRTPDHKETRHDVIIKREKYDIEIELDASVSNTTTEKTLVVSGTCEPGASIIVDTDYMEDSYQMDMNTGRFSFIAKIDKLGENVVRFHATMPGRQDAYLSLIINYKPTLAQYSAKAWKMDYEQLRKYFENWIERIFLCTGPIVDRFEDDGTEYFVMDVNPTGERQLIILENQSDAQITVGASYSAYADVAGRHFYTDNYYPLLVARYIDSAS